MARSRCKESPRPNDKPAGSRLAACASPPPWPRGLLGAPLVSPHRGVGAPAAVRRLRCCAGWPWAERRRASRVRLHAAATRPASRCGRAGSRRQRARSAGQRARRAPFKLCPPPPRRGRRRCGRRPARSTPRADSVRREARWARSRALPELPTRAAAAASATTELCRAAGAAATRVDLRTRALWPVRRARQRVAAAHSLGVHARPRPPAAGAPCARATRSYELQGSAPRSTCRGAGAAVASVPWRPARTSSAAAAAPAHVCVCVCEQGLLFVPSLGWHPLATPFTCRRRTHVVQRIRPTVPNTHTRAPACIPKPPL